MEGENLVHRQWSREEGTRKVRYIYIQEASAPAAGTVYEIYNISSAHVYLSHYMFKVEMIAKLDVYYLRGPRAICMKAQVRLNAIGPYQSLQSSPAIQDIVSCHAYKTPSPAIQDIISA